VTEHRVQMRWRDIDGLGHVGHSVALVYLEEGRDAFLATHGISRRDYVVGRCEVTFRREVDAGLGEIVAGCEAAKVGRSSLVTREEIRDAAGEVLIEAEFGLVLWDADRRESRPLTAAERESLTAGSAA
jgi:acyl-CoA thioesterase FadM